MSNILFEKSRHQDLYLEFGKALLSSDTNFPEVPPEIARDIIDIFIEESIAPQVFPFRTMSSDTLKIYVKSGTVSVSSPSEGVAPAESKLTFGAPVTLTAKELRALSKVSYVADEEGIIDLVAETVRDMGRKLAEAVDRNVLAGKGDSSDVYNLFYGVQFADTKPGSATTVKDLAKAAVTTDHILEAVTVLESLGYRDNLVMFIHPRAAYHLRKDLASKGLEGISVDVFRTGRVNELFGISNVYITTHLERRDYSGTDTTKVSDIIICHRDDTGIGGYRRQITIERDRDIAAGLHILAGSLRFAWEIARTDAVYKIQNALAQ